VLEKVGEDQMDR